MHRTEDELMDEAMNITELLCEYDEVQILVSRGGGPNERYYYARADGCIRGNQDTGGFRAFNGDAAPSRVVALQQLVARLKEKAVEKRDEARATAERLAGVAGTST